MLFLVLAISRFDVSLMPAPPSAPLMREADRFTAKIDNVHVRLVPREKGCV